MAKTTRDDHVTGQDALLKFKAGGQTFEIDVSNVSWTRTADTTTTRHNDGLSPTLTITGVNFSGSFEYSGRNYEAMNALVHGQDLSVSGSDDQIAKFRNQPVRGTLSVKEFESSDDGTREVYTYTFERCIITDTSRDLPATDTATTNYSWEAEDLLIEENGQQDGTYL